MRQMLHTRRGPGGFTLVELLVVVTIIALIIVILLPGVERAVVKAGVAQCQGILRQMGSAFVMFAAEHKGQMPDGTWTVSMGYGYTSDTRYYRRAIPYYMGINPSFGVGMDLRMCFCPGVRTFYYTYDWDIGPYGHHFYVYNNAWYGPANGVDEAGWPTYVPVYLSQARHPAEVFLVLDGTGATHYSDQNPSAFGDWFLPRHGGGRPAGAYNLTVPAGVAGNALFADGHVEFLIHGGSDSNAVLNYTSVTNFNRVH